MEQIPKLIWTAACAHHLQKHWRTVDPTELEAVASEIWRDPHLQAQAPDAAATEWLRPIEAKSSRSAA